MSGGLGLMLLATVIVAIPFATESTRSARAEQWWLSGTVALAVVVIVLSVVTA